MAMAMQGTRFVIGLGNVKNATGIKFAASRRFFPLASTRLCMAKHAHDDT
jgi:hypothetical protein